MDLRVYVDGVARIICDLTRTTTVHDVIIALAQYKGKTGRYSLIERAPDGTQRTLSPNELTYDLINHPDWTYILKQNSDTSNGQKRSKSLDGRKTPMQQSSTVEVPSAVTSLSSSASSTTNSTSGRHRTVNDTNNHTFVALSSSSSIKSSDKKKHSHLRHVFPLDNVNNNNNSHLSSNEHSSPISFIIEQKCSSRAPIQIIEQDFGVVDNHRTSRRPRPKSALPSMINENSAFQIVHNPIHRQANSQHHHHHHHYHHHHQQQQQQQQQQYIALLKILKSQEIQVEQQQKELMEKDKEIEYREKTIQQNSLESQFSFLKEHDYRLNAECSMHNEEYSTNELNKEIEYEKKLQTNYEHLQQQLNICSTTLEQKRQLHEQMQLTVEKTHGDIEQIQTNIVNDKKDIGQFQQDVERCNATLNQQEDLVRMLVQRNDEIDRLIQQRRQQIDELESELIKTDDVVISGLAHPSYHFRSISSTPQHYNSLPSTNSLSSSSGTTTEGLMSIRLQLVNSTLWKLCPSGIWV